MIHFFALRSTPKFDFLFLHTVLFPRFGRLRLLSKLVDMTKALQTKCNAWFRGSQEDSTCALKIEFQNLFF